MSSEMSSISGGNSSWITLYNSKHTLQSLGSVSVFRWHPLSCTQSTELVPISGDNCIFSLSIPPFSSSIMGTENYMGHNYYLHDSICQTHINRKQQLHHIWLYSIVKVESLSTVTSWLSDLRLSHIVLSDLTSRFLKKDFTMYVWLSHLQ
jgi:hypothetical protein